MSGSTVGGIFSNAVQYWRGVAARQGDRVSSGEATPLAATAVHTGARAMEMLLQFSGVPDLEQRWNTFQGNRSTSEALVDAAGQAGRAARFGMGLGTVADLPSQEFSELALSAGVVALNAVPVARMAGNAVRAGRTAGTVRAAEAAVAEGSEVVRHYTSVAGADAIENSGRILASRTGNAGFNQVYLLAEETGEGGMNFLRRLNIGYLNPAETARAVEINLAKLPPEVAAQFRQSLASGPLSLENFITHDGEFVFKEFTGAVRFLDTEQLAVSLAQVTRAGGSVAQVGALAQDTRAAVTEAFDADLEQRDAVGPQPLPQVRLEDAAARGLNAASEANAPRASSLTFSHTPSAGQSATFEAGYPEPSFAHDLLLRFSSLPPSSSEGSGGSASTSFDFDFSPSSPGDDSPSYGDAGAGEED